MRSLERVNIRTNVRTYVRTYVLTYIRTGQTLYPLHNFVVRGDNKLVKRSASYDLYDFILRNFLLKKMRAVCNAKASYIFSTKHWST